MADPQDQVFRVLPRQVGQTVAAALRGWLPSLSWSQIRRLFTARRVMVSGNLCTDAGRRLKLVDVVKVLEHSLPPPPRPEAIRVRFLDRHVVVVEKPPGVTTTRHSEERDWAPRRRQIQPTLDEMLPALIQRQQPRPRREGSRAAASVRAVHRLDRETSGLIIFARTAIAERNLTAQFRQHSTGRRYIAVATGKVPATTIETRLVRDRGDGRRGSTDLPNVGKVAITHVRPLEDLGDYTLVECQLETGRTHQIRIHLAELGHPLCGEKVYNQPRFSKPLPDTSGAPRVALHAAYLAFDHPVTGERLEFESPTPADLAEFLERLRRRKGEG